MISYITVQSQNDSYLKLVRKPTLFSQFILIGMLIGIMGVIFFGTSDSFLKNAALLILVVGVSISTGEGFEVCELDLAAGEARLSSPTVGQHLLAHLLPAYCLPYVQVVKLSDVKSADVEIQESDNTAHRVILRTEYEKFGITKIFTHDPVKDLDAVAEKINKLLKINSPVEKDNMVESTVDDDYSTDENSQDDVDSEFETISKADVEGFEERNEVTRTDTKDNEVDQ